MEKQAIGLPAGFRDILFDDAAKRRNITTTLAPLLAREGYKELSPSTIEFLDLYSRGHQSVRQRAFRFLDRDDNLLALRADFTPAVARIAAGPLKDEPLPLKLWYCGSVFRKTGRERGGFTEMAQIGAELIGDGSASSDAGLLKLMLTSLQQLGIAGVSLHLNHAGIFRGIVRELRLSPKAIRALKAEIDRKDVRGLADHLDGIGVGQELQQQLHQLSRLIGPASVLDEALGVLTNEESRSAIGELRTIASQLTQWRDLITFDLSEIDDLEYYTGVMCAVFTSQLNRELGKGGRYDSLLREFGRDLPAVGFSLSLDAMVELV